MPITTWDEVLKRSDIVGGDIETQEDGDIYRGPIESIEKDGDIILIKSPWMAKMTLPEGKWRKWNIFSMSLNPEEIQPNDIGQGRIMFRMPALGLGTIFPKGGSKLDPSKVEGLETVSID